MSQHARSLALGLPGGESRCEQCEERVDRSYQQSDARGVAAAPRAERPCYDIRGISRPQATEVLESRDRTG
jgi:hypothetical protein